MYEINQIINSGKLISIFVILLSQPWSIAQDFHSTIYYNDSNNYCGMYVYINSICKKFEIITVPVVDAGNVNLLFQLLA